jgi:drug/metabolite transporter (DMT)-like permease
MSATGKGIVFALFAGFVYGLAPPFTRLAFVNGVPAIETAFWRVSALVVIVGLIAIVMRWRLRVPQGAGGLLALMALSTGAISIGYLGAVQFIPVALAVIIFFTFPILILILSPMIEGRGVRWPQLAIGAVAFAGLLVALGPNPGNADWRGLCLAALAAGGAATQFFTGRALSSKMSPLHFGLLAHIAIVPVVAALIAFMGGEFKTILAPEGIAISGYLALAVVALSYSGGYFFQMYALKSAPASAVAPYFNIEPVTSVAFAGLLLAEPPMARELAGGALVLAALFAAGLAGRTQRWQD